MCCVADLTHPALRAPLLGGELRSGSNTISVETDFGSIGNYESYI
jgi:hypothetical protein